MTEPANQGPAALCLLANVSASDQPPDCDLNLGLGPPGSVDFSVTVGGIKPEDTVPNAASNADGKCLQTSSQSQGVVNAELMPVVVAQSVLVDGQLSGVPETPRNEIAPAYQQHGVVVHGLRGLTVHTVSYSNPDGLPGIGGATTSQQQQKDRLKEKQKNIGIGRASSSANLGSFCLQAAACEASTRS